MDFSKILSDAVLAMINSFKFNVVGIPFGKVNLDGFRVALVNALTAIQKLF